MVPWKRCQKFGIPWVFPNLIRAYRYLYRHRQYRHISTFFRQIGKNIISALPYNLTISDCRMGPLHILCRPECEEDPSCTQLLLNWEIPRESQTLTSLPGNHRVQEFLLTQVGMQNKSFITFYRHCETLT